MPILLTFPELRDRGMILSRRQVDRLEAMNKFPKRVSLSEARVAWLEVEIDDWIKERIEQRSMALGTLGSGLGRVTPRRRR
ncbi:AlpA family phage regulatory protein [Bradyrhizobium sp. INPA03-11B]|uniref:helix-turn-helix transcriptional regulator n=1 Tax=Bradyrhizobium sp. INPA03-11B TaxID=418598 RepID=UPI00338E9DFE